MLLFTQEAGKKLTEQSTDQVQMSGNTRFQWQTLPAEIRLIILEFLVSQAGHGTGRLSKYASVCLDWKAFLEKVTFRSINLPYSPFEIITFQSYMSGSRVAACKKITFHISLRSYTCDGCDKKEDEATILKNNARFTEGLVSLFSVMSSWTLPTGHGIWLEMCASSPSDTRHSFRNAENDDQSSRNDQSQGVLTHRQQPRVFSRFGSKQRPIGSLLDFLVRTARSRYRKSQSSQGFQ